MMNVTSSEMKDDDKIQFDGKIRKIGGSYYALIKPELIEYLSLRDGSKIKLQTEHGEHGRYLSLWSPAQQNAGE